MAFSVIFFVLLAALSQPLSAADGWRPVEEMTTAELVDELVMLSDGQLSGLETLGTDLENARMQLEESKDELRRLKGTLTLQQERLDDSTRTLEGLKSWLPSLLEEQQRTISSQETWLWILTGVAAALAVGVVVAYVT